MRFQTIMQVDYHRKDRDIMSNDKKQNRRLQVRVDTYTRICLSIIAVLLTVIIMGLWSDGVHFSDSAQAGGSFLDSAAQRKTLINNQKETNETLKQILTHLKSGKMKVVVDDKTTARTGGNDGGKKSTLPQRP